MQRNRIPELMDSPTVDPRAHAHALQTLNRVNQRLGVDAFLEKALMSFGHDRLSVLDLGCGGGGFLSHLLRGRHADRFNTMVGLDRSAQALHCARAWHSRKIHWLSADARRIPLRDESVDVVTCSLFLHHFDETGGKQILQEAARVSRLGIIISDLSRSRLAWLITWLMTRILSRSRIFHVDGPRSVRAAYGEDELTTLAHSAGLAGAIVKKSFPFRLLLVWKKPNP